MVFLANRFPKLISLPAFAIFVSRTSGITAILKRRSVNPIIVKRGDVLGDITNKQMIIIIIFPRLFWVDWLEYWEESLRFKETCCHLSGRRPNNADVKNSIIIRINV